MLSACSSMIKDVTLFVTATTKRTNIKLNLKSVLDMKDYVPYHADLDIQKRLPQDRTSLVNTACTIDEPYLVEKVVKKRFSNHQNQHEYLIKWQGYTSSENTWELPENIPANMLAEFEKQLLAASSQTSEPRQSGLHQSRKVAHKSDYILNF